MQYNTKGTTHKLRVFTTRVLERDNFECQHCYATKNLHIHHIKKRKTNPELGYDVNNGITLCSKCHKIFENWIDAPWNRRKICEGCNRQISAYWEEPIPFNKIWDGKKWMIKETVKKRCKN
jgi:HNH endonuclease